MLFYFLIPSRLFLSILLTMNITWLTFSRITSANLTSVQPQTDITPKMRLLPAVVTVSMKMGG
ncbi:hypothetical protein UA45_08415 [Morganella morganii]|uniref:Uncharacterized protein n=1 Tax=Morganella morganii TaxID=582 RepID=A0A0D8L8M6_MORMO|nr:hypothetical protein UA45_08415 [Morganella morganii]